VTANKDEIFGTPDKHFELRKKACDHIQKNINSEPYKSVLRKWSVSDTGAYIKRKRATEG
jgi:hypothetical protein